MGDVLIIIYHISQQAELDLVGVSEFKFVNETTIMLYKLDFYCLGTLLLFQEELSILPNTGRIVIAHLVDAWCFGAEEEREVCIQIEKWIHEKYGICIAPHKDVLEGCRARQYPQCARGVICTRKNVLMVAWTALNAWQKHDSIEAGINIIPEVEDML